MNPLNPLAYLPISDILTLLTAVASIIIAVTAVSITYVITLRKAKPPSPAAAPREFDRTDNTASAKHIDLLREYHAQGLSQSRISFWFSLLFASLGFAVILLSVGLFLQQNQSATSGWLEGAGKPAFALIAGTIIDAVAALFFVQSNKARQLMIDFFDKLRSDRKLEEALRLASEISDSGISSRLKALISVQFADVKVDPDVWRNVVGLDAPKNTVPLSEGARQLTSPPA